MRNAVVVVFRQSGTGRCSGVRVERDFFGVCDLRESKVVRFRLPEANVVRAYPCWPRQSRWWVFHRGPTTGVALRRQHPQALSDL